MRSLVASGAIGIVTTHDLALAEIAEKIPQGALNMHLEDWLDGSEIRFDYKLKPGTVTRGNALALMRAIGLEV